MCHVKAGAKDKHGPRFLAELARLAERGEAWAEQERQVYADPQRCITESWRDVRRFMEDVLLNTEDLSSLKWGRGRIKVAHRFGMSAPELTRRYQRIRQTWTRLRQEEALARERERSFEETVKASSPPK